MDHGTARGVQCRKLSWNWLAGGSLPPWQCEAAQSQTWQTEAASAVSPLAEPLSCLFLNCSKACTWQQLCPRQAHGWGYYFMMPLHRLSESWAFHMHRHEEYKIKAVTTPTTCFHLLPGHAAPFYGYRTAPWVNSRVDPVHRLHASVHKIPRLSIYLKFMGNSVSLELIITSLYQPWEF